MVIFSLRCIRSFQLSLERTNRLSNAIRDHQFYGLRLRPTNELNLSNDDGHKISMSTTKSSSRMRKTQLRQDLKQYRLQQSTPLNKPPFTVFTNACLEEIYLRLPTTKGELLEVKGIGPKKLEMFGDDILSIVAPYTDVNGGVRSVSRSAGEAKTPPPDIISKDSLTIEQRETAEIFLDEARPNGFVTGSAGTGKSHLLKYLVQELRLSSASLKVGVCAPTGIAAVNVGGSTLHAFFGIGLGTGSLSSLRRKLKSNPEARKRIDETDVLIIDECSMMSSMLLETVDGVTRNERLDGKLADKPFGGMQVICFGDFFQLPPVTRGGDRHTKPFCFDSPVWQELNMSEHSYELKQVIRQSKNEFIDLLNRVRVGRVSESDIVDLNKQCLVSDDHPFPTDGIMPTRLYTHNSDVDNENSNRLAELTTPEVLFRAKDSWRPMMPSGTLATIKKQMKISLTNEMPDEVVLKVGAQVMLTRNKNLDQNLVNGSRGVVVRFDEKGTKQEMVPVVKFDTGLTIPVTPVEASRHNPDGGEGCLVRTQVPLKLAWALTVHKSQGSTLSRASLNLASAFEYGQCYVALSRVQSLDGLWLSNPVRADSMKVSPQVLDFYDEFRSD